MVKPKPSYIRSLEDYLTFDDVEAACEKMLLNGDKDIPEDTALVEEFYRLINK